jgi:hypothetical protein
MCCGHGGRITLTVVCVVLMDGQRMISRWLVFQGTRSVTSNDHGEEREMNFQVVTSTRIGASNTAPKVLLAALSRLPVFNTFSCNMEIKDIVSHSVRLTSPYKSGACAPLTHQACLAGSGPRSGLTLSLAVTHRKAFFEAIFFRNSFVHGGLFDGE